MRRLLIILSLFAGISSFAAERVFVVTDRTAYLSGDRVWCSLFCMDENGRVSDLSSVAYIELVGVDGSAAEAKIGLFKGRGSGEFVLPVSVSTGNYRLMAYTSLGGEESAIHGSRIISIYNPFSTARVSSGVIADSHPASLPVPEDFSNGIKILVPGAVRQGATFTMILEGTGADVAVSVSHQDDMVQLQPSGIDTFLQGFPNKDDSFPEKLEYDGETIQAITTGAREGDVAILSSAGSPDDTYVSTVKADGSVEFRTGNIYGDRDMVCEVIGADENVRISLLSPFRHPSAGSLPALHLHRDQFSSLVRRKEARSVQIKADTLVQFLTHREDRMLNGVTWERCHLDDYERFHTVQEVIVELLPLVRYRTSGGVPRLEVCVSDGTDSRHVFKGPVLVMMDGVVVSDLNLLLGFDAMLLDDIDVCREPVVADNTLFNGVVNFITKNNYVTALHFPAHVCVEEFKGVRFPVNYTGGVPSDGTDLREVLYWHPAIQLDGQTSISVTAPAYSGSFVVMAEGIDSEGMPVRGQAVIEVK